MKRITALLACLLLAAAGCAPAPQQLPETEETYVAITDAPTEAPETAEITGTQAPDTTEITETEAETSAYPELEARFGGLLRYFYDPSDEFLLAMEEVYQTRLEDYEARLEEIQADYPETGSTTFLEEETEPALSAYSPITAALYLHQEDIHINPVVLAEELTEPYHRTEYEDGYIDYEIDLGVKQKLRHDAQVYSDPRVLIGQALQEVAEASYFVGYSAEEDLYYVYLVDTDVNLSVTALYFEFNDDGVLTRTGIDNLIYTGGEVNTADSEQLLLHETPLEIKYSPEFDPVYMGDEKTALLNMTGILTGLLGSAQTEEDLIEDGDITSESSYKPDYVRTTHGGDYQYKALHYVTWFEIA